MSETTFRQAYAVLQKHAETLRTQKEPNIDELLTIVTESVDAYKVCKTRIDAVAQALEQALAGIDWHRLLFAGSVLARSDERRPREAEPASMFKADG